MSTDQLINYTLHLADNALIIGHRNSEWTGHGPILEQDIAISNIALDLVGQARNFYQYAAKIYNDVKEQYPPLIKSPAFQQITGAIDEDDLAYLRNENEYKNCLLAEQENGDWAKTIARQFFFSTYQFLLYQQLQSVRDEQLAAIAAKALKEVTYHLRWSSEWVIRLGDGTEESHRRMQRAINDLWEFTGELYTPADYELQVAKEHNGIDVASLQEPFTQKIKEVLEEATLLIPENNWMQQGGKQGIHTERLGYLLAEMQFLQRAYPNSEW